MRKTHTEIHLRNEPEHGHKEYKYLYQQMLKDDVIRKAYKKLRKGKTKRKEIQYIDEHLDDEVRKMHDMILNTKPEGVDVPHPELAYKPKKRTPKKDADQKEHHAIRNTVGKEDGEVKGSEPWILSQTHRSHAVVHGMVYLHGHI